MTFLGNKRLFEVSNQNTKIINLFRLLFCSGIIFELVVIIAPFEFLNRLNCYPIEIFNWLSIPQASDVVYSTLFILLLVSLIFSALGILTRYSLATSTILFVYVVGWAVGCGRGKEAYYTSWSHSIIVFTLFILSVAPNIGAYNVVSLIKNKWKFTKVSSAGWGIELLKFHIVVSYFAGGIVKIKSGLDWMNGYTLQYYFIKRYLSGGYPLALELGQNLMLMRFFSISTVVLELLIPIAWFTKRSVGWMFMFATLVMQFLCWYIFKLGWFRFYGWSYLIYVLEVYFFVSLSEKKGPLRIP